MGKGILVQPVLELIVADSTCIFRQRECGQLSPILVENIWVTTNALPNQGSTCRARRNEIRRRRHLREDVIAQQPSHRGRWQRSDPLNAEAVQV